MIEGIFNPQAIWVGPVSGPITRSIWEINEIKEFNIGHYIIGEAISLGLKNVIKRINKFIKK